MPIHSISQFKMSSTDKLFPIFGVSDESYALSQLKYQTLLCDEDMLTCDSMLISSSIVSNHQKNSPSPAITIINNKNSNTINSSKMRSGSHGQTKSFNGLMNSFPMKFEKLRFEKQTSPAAVKEEISSSASKDKMKKVATSPGVKKSSASSYLAEKFSSAGGSKLKQNKKKSESEDFVLV